MKAFKAKTAQKTAKTAEKALFTVINPQKALYPPPA
jgi:hypothetical protein